MLEKIELGWTWCNCGNLSARQNVPKFDRLARERRDLSHMNSLLSPRAIARSIYESPVVAGFRRAHYEQYVERESRRTQSIVQALGFNLLTTDALDVLGGREKKTLFILGSGASVNRLTEAHFDVVRQNYSIGMNAWVSHSFVPDAYSFESDSISAPPSVEIKAMSEALSQRALAKPDTVLLLLRPKKPELVHRMVEVPESLRDRAFMYGRHNLLTRTNSALRQDLGPFLANRLKNFERRPVLIDNGASVVRMIDVGLYAGFREIVLLGIDLNSSPYFWEATDTAPSHREMRGLYQRPPNSEHDTLETFDRPYSNLLFIEELARGAERVFGASVYVGSEGSSLSGKIPDYDWNVVQTASKKFTSAP